jgi:hypothetical protein
MKKFQLWYSMVLTNLLFSQIIRVLALPTNFVLIEVLFKNTDRVIRCGLPNVNKIVNNVQYEEI